MTPEEYNERLTELYGLVSGDITADTIVPAARELLFEIKNRIANEGQNSNGVNIGEYSTKPIYVTPQNFVSPGAFAPGGKIGAKGSKSVLTRHVKQADKLGNGRGFLKYLDGKKGKHYTQLKNDHSDYKSMYLAEGYSELRQIQGLRIDIVNLTYRGDLLMSYQMQKISQYVLLGLTEESSVLKRSGLEKKYGDVFHGTSAEIERYISRVNFSMSRLTRGILSGEGVQGVPIVENV